MKILNYVLILAFGAIFFTSCQTTKLTQSVPTTIDYLPPVITPEVEIGERIEGKSTRFRFLILPMGGGAINKRAVVGVEYTTKGGLDAFGNQQRVGKSGKRKFFAGRALGIAAYKALNSNDKEMYDFIVNPNYEIKRREFILFGWTTATVKGWGGTYKGFKQLPMEQQIKIMRGSNKANH